MCDCISKIEEAAAKKGVKIYLPFVKMHYQTAPDSEPFDIVEEYELNIFVKDKDGNRGKVLFESDYCPFCGRKKFKPVVKLINN